MAPELKPDFIILHAAMKSRLFALGIVSICAKVFAFIVLRSGTSTLAGHAGKIIEDSHHAGLPSFAALKRHAADEFRVVALDDDRREIFIPEIGHLENPPVALRYLHARRWVRISRRANLEDGFSQWIVGIQCQLHRLSKLGHELAAIGGADQAVRHARRDMQ